MKYRKFGQLDFSLNGVPSKGQVSALAFGCMRLPTTDNQMMSANVKEDESIKMIRHAIDRGVNYVDTAYPYHNGQSEVVTGQALLNGYRDKVKLATKSPIWLINEASDFDKYLTEQLQRLQTDHIDFYLLHGLGKELWAKILKLNLIPRAEAALKDKRIRHLGFSFHDDFDSFKQIIDGYDKWEFCQIQYNYMDVENQAGTKGLKYAASKGIPVVVMEPLLGGKLSNPPQRIKDIFRAYNKKKTPADWALQWVWNQPEVATVLSGMSSMAQVEENLKSAESAAVNSLTKEELELIDKVRRDYKGMFPISCTKCGYCMPCPNGVLITRNFELYNDAQVYGDNSSAKFMYARMARIAGEKTQASACKQCHECEKKCPQQLPISEWLGKVHKELG